MRLLLDTHAFIWWDNGRLPKVVTTTVQEADDVYVSAVTAWEIAIKTTLGKIVVRGSVADAIGGYGFSPLPITVEPRSRKQGLAPPATAWQLTCKPLPPAAPAPLKVT